MACALRTLSRCQWCFGTQSKALASPENAHGPRGPVRPKRGVNRAFRIATCLGRDLRNVGARWNDRTGEKPCRLVIFPATNGPLLRKALLA
jgi:hypothetical protein